MNGKRDKILTIHASVKNLVYGLHKLFDARKSNDAIEIWAIIQRIYTISQEACVSSVAWLPLFSVPKK